LPRARYHLASYLESTAAHAPNRVAVIDPGRRAVSYGELDDAAGRLAAFLRTNGVHEGARVGVMMRKSVNAVTAIFGVLKAGATYVPVDPQAPLERARKILMDCGVSALCVDDKLVSVLDAMSDESRPATIVVSGEGAIGERSARCISWDSATALAPLPHDLNRGTSGLAYILYTSGSTGMPKGAQINHVAASSFVEWATETFSPTAEDRFSSHAPFHFDLSIFDLYVAIKHGASVHLIGEELTGAPRALAQFIADRDITVWYSTPSALTLLGEHGRLDRLPYRGPRVALFAGEVFPVKHLQRMTRLWPASSWYNLYGPTETNVCTFAHIPLPVPEDRTEPYPIGVPCSHCEARLLLDDGAPAAEEGLLYIAGDPVFEGYWNRPDVNARVFRLIDGKRYYNTGDVVRVDSHGEFIFLGRRDRMVKRRGYRVELGEIEHALYRHPRLREVGVVSMEDETGVRIIACYAGDEPGPSIVELKQFASREIPVYMVPDEFRAFDRLPSTSTGKMDYQQLKSWLGAPAGRANGRPGART